MAFDPLGAIQAAREMHELADDAMAKADKLLDKVNTVVDHASSQVGILANNILDRFSKCVIHLEITQPRATAVNPDPEKDKTYT